MGKVRNRKRKELFEELERNGKLPPPQPVKRKRRLVVKAKQVDVCCLIRYENELPMGFRPCLGCPLTQQT
jgi:hypothetical protein